MPTLKVRCPECEANIKQPVDAVDEPTDIDITCPKCGHEFVAIAEPEEEARPEKAKKADTQEKQSKKSAKANKKPIKASSSDDDEDEEDNKPRKKKKKKQAEAGNQKLIIGIGAGVLLIGGIVGAILAFGGKGKDTAKTGDTTSPPSAQTPQQGPGGMPNPGGTPGMPNPGGGPYGKPNPGGPNTGGYPYPGNPGGMPPGTNPGTNPNPGTTPGTNPNPPKTDPPKTDPPKKDPPKKDPDALPPGMSLPAPPKLKLSGPAAPVGKLDAPVGKPVSAPPLQPDEDPFVRSKQFRLDMPLPTLPKLPPVAQRPLLTLDPGGHTAFIVKSFITPKGDQVITVGEDKAVRIWDIQTGDPIQTIRLPAGLLEEGKIQAAALAPNGKRLAVAGKPLKAGTKGNVPVFIINLETGALVKTLAATQGEEVGALDFSADGNQLAVASNNTTLYKNTPNAWVQLLNAQTGQSAGEVSQLLPVLELRYNPNPKERILATIGYDRQIHIYHIGNASKNRTINTGTSSQPTDIAWTIDGGTLGVSMLSGEIVLYTLEGQLFKTIPAHSEKVKIGDATTTKTVEMRGLRFLMGGKEIACCGAAGAQGWAGIKDIDSGKVRLGITAHTNIVQAIGVSSDGTRAVSSGGNQHETYAWDTADGKIVSRLCGSGMGIWGVGWAKDGKSLAYGITNLINPDDTRALDFSFRFDDFGPGPAPDETKYEQATKSDGTFACLRLGKDTWGVGPTNGKPFKLSVPDEDKIYAASLIPGRKMVVAAGASSLTLLDPENGKVIRSFKGHTGNVLSVASSPDGKYFVTGSSDQTIRIWLPEFEDPFLSIFVGGSEWIAWTPQGFYSCSGNGERLLAWQVNNGSFKFPQVHPAARFRPSMYQPALIKYLVPAGSMPLALAMATKFDKALVQITSVADVLPPEVTLLSPDVEKSDVVDQPTVSVRASAKGTAKQPITAMRLLVDGRPFQGSEGVKKFDTPQATAEASWEVPVLPGPHSFAVIAESPVSKGMSKVGYLTRAGDPPRPDLYVLAMGVSEYPGDMKLKYAASDAKLLAKTFEAKSKAVFGKVEIRVLTDSQATRKGMRDAMDWLKANMTPKDVGIVSFSGHGTRDFFSDKFYLVPVDFNPEDTAGTGFSGDELKTRLENMPGRIVAILDACHSGTVAGQAKPVARTDGLVRDLVAEDSGVIVMCASLGREFALESPLTKAGFYTFSLVEGMNGQADIDGDGLVYIHELDLYAGARVKQLSRWLGGRQTPTISRPPGIRPFPIAKP
jgi:WD40 repeat protein